MLGYNKWNSILVYLQTKQVSLSSCNIFWIYLLIRFSPCIYQRQIPELLLLRTTYWNATMSKLPGHGYVVCRNWKLVATVEIFNSLSAEDFDCPGPTGWAAALQPLTLQRHHKFEIVPRVVWCKTYFEQYIVLARAAGARRWPGTVTHVTHWLYEPGGAEWELEGEEPGIQYGVQYCTNHVDINDIVQY